MTPVDLEILGMIAMDVADGDHLPALIEVARRRVELQDWLDHVALSATTPPRSVCKLLDVPGNATMRECIVAIRRRHVRVASAN